MSAAGIWIGTLMMALAVLWIGRSTLVPISQSMRRPARRCSVCDEMIDQGGMFRGCILIEEPCEDCEDVVGVGM